MTDKISQEKVDRSRLRLLAALSAGAAGGGCAITGSPSIPNDGPRAQRPQPPQDFGSSGGGGSGGGGGGGH